MCRDCGYVVQCPNCDISLTYHRFNDLMKCHYCGHEEGMPTVCPECKSEHIRFFGTGTQKVEEEIAKILPEARVIRMDVDTTSKKGSHERFYNAFGEGKADIITWNTNDCKGLDFPNITLVGVLTADTMLHLPDFRSSEKTFQLLTQVSGRAGRHEFQVKWSFKPIRQNITVLNLLEGRIMMSFINRKCLFDGKIIIRHIIYIVLITVSHEEL